MNEFSLFSASPTTSPAVLTVSALNRLARECLEGAFPLCWVAGEISNLTIAASGHAYFSLKDGSAQVRCVMFRNRAQLLGWRLANGQHVEARVLVTLYEARGDFQLNVEMVRQAGVGNLHEQFLRLKERLEQAGLFAEAIKRPLPVFPRRLGIVTSPQAAALRDVISTLKRRAPHLDVVLYPTPVQGDDASAQIVAALTEANQHGYCDVLILCRGGGSLEDLWAFNAEDLARALRASRIPVVTGIGHETDFTIADFAADRRAATPTAAAELAAPEKAVLQKRLYELQKVLADRFARRVESLGQRLDLLAYRLIHPGQHLTRQREQIGRLNHRLSTAWHQAAARHEMKLIRLGQRLFAARPDTQSHQARLERLGDRMRHAVLTERNRRAAELMQLAAKLELLDPRKILARGYSIVHRTDGRIVRDSRLLEPNDAVSVSFFAGGAEARITSTHH